jgi:hypothetical protein
VQLVTGEAHDGHANRETWCVSMWLHGEEPLYRRTLALARLAARDAPLDEYVSSGIWSVEQTARFRLADTLKRWVCDTLAPDLGASFASDLLTGALSEVVWHDIAEDFLGEVRETEATA